jgi:GNAT superfamily N-acetyltransferase
MIELSVDDHPTLQALLDECTDHAVLHDGRPFGPSAARDEFDDLPPGSTSADKFVHGLVGAGEHEDRLIAVVESVRRYPDPSTWWLGLLLVRPDRRNEGIGSCCYGWFEQRAAASGATDIALGVIAENRGGRVFWQRHGFDVERTVDDHRMGRRRHRLLVLRKRIATAASGR